MRPLLSAVAVGVARAVDMVAVAVQLLAFAALPCDGARVVEASAEAAEKPRAAIPATNVAASLVPAFIRMPCSSEHPVCSTRGWPLPLVSAYPAQAGAGPGTAAVPSGASPVPGQRRARIPHHVFGAEADFYCRSQQVLRRSLPAAPCPLPSRATSGRSRNQASEKRLSVNPLDGARDQAAGRAWLRPTERSGSCPGPRCPAGTELAAVATLLEGSAPAPIRHARDRPSRSSKFGLSRSFAVRCVRGPGSGGFGDPGCR